MAETTTATSWPASTSRLTWRATLRMRSISATEVPPNFITRRAMAGLRASPEGWGRAIRFTASPRAKTRVYIPVRPGGRNRALGEVDGKQCEAEARFKRRRRRGRALFGPGQRMVAPPREDGRSAQVQSGATWLHQGRRVPAV